MGGGGSKYKIQVGSQVTVPSWIFRVTDSSELVKMNLESFELQSVIGKGKFGIVYYAQHKSSSKFVAIKFISKKILFETKGRERTQQEINILKMVSHPFIVAYLGAFECPGAISLVFEYAAGGELYNRMKKDGTLTEQASKFYFCEIASAIAYLHSLNIVYRDLKPENVLIHINGHIKLCDFGFATVVGSTDTPLHDGCGTAMYVAPEIAGGNMKLSHGLPVDWWSLGCILYEMVVGEAPFGDTDKMSKFEIFNNINGAQVSFPLNVGGNFKSLIRGLLDKNQQQRFNFSAVKMHPWVAEINWDEVNITNISPPWIPTDCNLPNKRHFLDWPGESYPTGCTPQENHYCSSFDLSVNSRLRREATRSRLDPEKSPTSPRRKSRSESRNSFSHESGKSDMSTPAPRLSETKSRSSSKLLESSIHPGSRSRSQSRLESLPSPSRQKGSVSDAAKNALLQSEEAEEITNHKHPQKHGMKHHVPVY